MKPDFLKSLLKKVKYFLHNPHKTELLNLYKERIKNWSTWLLVEKIKPFTMVGESRLFAMANIVRQVEKEKIPGKFIECGVWKGGCAAIMTKTARTYNASREIWLFDSFEGLPEPSESDGAKAQEEFENNPSPASTDDVKKTLALLGLNVDNIYFIKGWFEESFPQVLPQIDHIAILRLDCDWYESTKLCLESFYDRVVPRGFIVIDDYGSWPGCKKAVDEFFACRQEKPAFRKIGKSGAIYFRK